MIVLVKGDAMKVVLGHVTTQRSWKRPSNVWNGDCRDGEKLLCNRCPLKHEALEREREG